MNYFYLFLVVGVVIVYLIIQYDIQNKKKVETILRANKNVPPLFMLRSAELKVIAIRAALTSGDSHYRIDEKKVIQFQLDKLMEDYKNRSIPLTTYYAKLGALLIRVDSLKNVPAVVEA